ncbi:septal ring lytic transglycosylase RlpA family protein [Reyranella sp.]|uniref:septal ring lytic transglycosylase RlpA family protein n=1 Tax=Reyranella sp. TaxID=1929291 RepID=UPI003782D2A4
MSRFPVRLGLAALLMVSLGACGSSSKGGGASAAAPQRGTYKIGNPYTVEGVVYTPKEEFNRVETGVASWYGPGFHGKSTANGERYDQSDRTAAHRTLQMPSIVRVTNLENGQSTVVRINDRGPFARSRVIDLSRTAAEELDVVGKGTARVRIEQLQAESLAVKEVALSGGGPAEQHAAVAQLSSGRRTPAAASRAVEVAAPPPPPPPAPPAQPQPQPQPQQPPMMVWNGAPQQVVVETNNGAPASSVTVASLVSPAASAPNAGAFYVQTGAFSTAENAERQRDAVRSYGATEVFRGSAGGRDVFRVRLGPYTTSDAAGIVADRLKRSGYGDARVVAN